MSLSALLRYPYRMRHRVHIFTQRPLDSHQANPPSTHLGTLLVVLALLISLSLGAGLTGCSAGSGSASGLVYDGAYIKTPVPGKDLSAAYARVTNRSEQAICLQRFEASFAQRVELHATQQSADRVRMQRQAELCIDPGQTAALEPGGMHFMLFGVAELSAEGEPLTVNAIDSTQQSHPIAFERRAFNAPPP